MSIYTRDLELTYPPLKPDAMVAEMRAAVEAEVPVGEKLHKLVGKLNFGPDIKHDLSGTCWRMRVTFETEEIEPLVWAGD